ncbi:reverse transcriptase domain-containing protein [Tanacetum coccineum]
MNSSIVKALDTNCRNTSKTEAEMAMTAITSGELVVEAECCCSTVGHDVAYEMTWKTLKKMMTDKYYPRGEIKKLEIKLSNLKVKGTDVESYKECFQELALMCGRMFPKESDEVEKYVGGLPDMIQESVMAFKLKKIQDAI